MLNFSTTVIPKRTKNETMADFDKSWEWRSVAAPPRETPKTSPWKLTLELLVPFAVAALFWIWGKVLLAAVVAGIGLLLLALRFGAPAIFELVLRGLTVLGRWIGKFVSNATLTIVYILVFSSTAIVGRLLKRDPLGLRRKSFHRSYWVDVPQVNRNHFFKRPFLVESTQFGSNRHSVKWFRVTRLVFNTMVILFLLNFVTVYVYDYFTSMRLDDDRPDRRSQLAVYQEEGWGEDYFREFSEAAVNVYRPYVGWARPDYQGRYVNISNFNRKTYRAATESPSSLSLFVFGGSTTWGTGARDEFTIPSYLAKLAEQDGIPLRVTNFGESGYVNWQNVIRIAEICADGEGPDFVVFYTGANDIYAKMQSPDAKRPHQNLTRLKKRFETSAHSNVAEWFKENSAIHKVAEKIGKWLKGESEAKKALKVSDATQPELVQEMARDLAAMLRKNRKFIRQVGAACGFESWYFWQPVIYTKKDLSAEERGHPPSGFGNLPRDLYLATTREIQANNFAVDLSDAFDSQDQTIYIDWAHVTELGNEIVARWMYDQIRPALTAKLAALGLRTLADEHSGN